MAATTIVTTEMMAAHLDDSNWIVVDCRFKLDDTAWGENAYAAGHIPGATYAHLDRDLSGAKTGLNGRHPLPNPAALTTFFGRLGITRESQVVVYDQDTGMFASRLWWLLRWMGHDSVAVLDGGFAKWTREQRPTSTVTSARAAVTFDGAPRADMIVDANAVAHHASSTMLLDARAPERFRGETEPLDRVPGHIPGAHNRFFQQNLDERGTFRSPDELRAAMQTATDNTAPGDIICYCGSGVTACHNLLALEHAGLSGARLYPGSWSEWCADGTRPIETSASGASKA